MTLARAIHDALTQLEPSLVSEEVHERRLRQDRFESLKARADTIRLPLRAEDRRRLLTGRYKVTLALNAVMGWWTALGGENVPRILCLSGPVGVGKTFAAAWALICSDDDVHNHMPAGAYVRARELVRWSKASWGDEARAFQWLCRSYFVVLDELGTEERSVAPLEEFFDERCANNRRTLVLSNLTKSEILDGRYGDRINDRLRGFGSVKELTGESLR